MQLINPIYRNSSSTNVSNLQNALQQAGSNIDAHEAKTGSYGASTTAAIQTIQKANSLPVTGIADADTIAAINKAVAARSATNTYSINGKITNGRGEPLSAQALSVWVVDLVAAASCSTATSVKAITAVRGYTQLAAGTTNIDGEFDLNINTPLNKPDVIVYAVSGDQILAHSSLSAATGYVNGTAIQNLSIVISGTTARGVSEFVRLMQTVTPAVTAAGQQLFELNNSHDQIQYLATQTGRNLTQMAQLVQSATLCSDAAASKLSPELMYGIARQKITMDWLTLLTSKNADITAAIQASIDQNLITPYDTAAIAAFVTAVQSVAAQQALTGTAAAQPGLAQALGLAVTDPKLQASFLTFYQNHTGTPEQFWADLQQQPDFKTAPAIVSTLQFTNQLMLLTGSHIPLIQELLAAKYTAPADLFRLDTAGWLAIVGKVKAPASGPASGDAAAIAEYASGVQSTLNAAFPTLKIASMVSQSQLHLSDTTLQPMLTAFFTQATAFDITSSRISDFSAIINNVAGISAGKLTDQIAAIQRIYQVSPSPDAMNTLMANSLLSSHQIINIPRQTFLDRFSEPLGGIAIATAVYERATFQNLRMKNIALRVREVLTGTSVSKIMNGPQQSAATAVVQSAIPDYTTLFGSPDDCACDDCLSMFSPAAYYVDIMQFLDNSRPNADGKTPLDILLERRPDLDKLLLTCENTNTIIPYIDLVNEIMEYYVVNSTNGGLTADPPATNLSNDTGDATVAQLRAEPQNIMQKAYSAIYEQSIYPFTLPYHQPLDVIRSFLAYLKTSRAALMQVFPFDISGRLNAVVPVPPIVIVPQAAVDAENLLMSLKEYEIITTQCNSGVLTATNFAGSPAPVLPIYRYYGFTDSDTGYLGELITVSTFLQHTGITYTDLIEILKTRFINPGRSAVAALENILAGATISPPALYAELKSNGWSGDSAFTAALAANNVSIASFTTWLSTAFTPFSEALTLYSADSGCDLSTTRMRSIQWIYDVLPANPAGPDPVITALSPTTIDRLSKLHRFIRLWNRSGWTLHEMDSIIIALSDTGPAAETDITPALISKLSIVSQINSLLNIPVACLACLWGDIDTYDSDAYISIYTGLFLNSSANVFNRAGARKAGIFSLNPIGEISGGKILLKDSLPAIAAAMKVTASDLLAIIDDIPNTQILMTTAVLDIPVLSCIYRYKVLADALGISISDLISVKTTFMMAPFPTGPIPAVTLTTVDPAPTLAFIQTVRNIQSAGFDISTLGYILGNVANSTADSAISHDQILQIIPSWRSSLLSIDDANPDSDIQNMTIDLLRKKLLLIFGKDVVNTFTGMLTGSNVSVIPIMDVILPSLPAAYPRYSYISQGAGTTKCLQCIGVMSDAEFQTLSALSSPGTSFTAAINAIYRQPANFFRDNFYGIYASDFTLQNTPSGPLAWTDTSPLIIPGALASKIIYTPATTGMASQITYRGIMSPNERDLLMKLNSAPPSPAVSFATTIIPYLYLQSRNPLDLALLNIFALDNVDPGFTVPAGWVVPSGTTQTTFYTSFLPFLKEQLKKNIVVQGMSALINLPPLSVQALIDVDLDTLIGALSATGVDTSYTISGASGQVAANIDFTPAGTSLQSLAIGALYTATWQGWICPEKIDEYLFTINLGNTGDTFSFLINGVVVLGQAGSSAAPGSCDVTMSLTGGQMYQIAITVLGTISASTALSLSWQTQTMPQCIIDTRDLYSNTQIQSVLSAIAAYYRAALFINGFSLTVSEIKYLILYQSDFANIRFTALLPPHWSRIYSYTQLRILIPADSLLALFRAAINECESPPPSSNPSSAFITISQGLCTKIAALANWNPAYLQYLVIGASPILPYYSLQAKDFRNETGFLQIKRAMDIAAVTGMAISDTGLPGWINVEVDTPVPAGSITSFDVFADLAAAIKNSVKAQYKNEGWQKLSGQLYDVIRENQKQALISYLINLGITFPSFSLGLPGLPVTDADSLYEYLLIDVQMCACMDTSRLIQATMAVQLFVSRCLMNLESPNQVLPGAIDAQQWGWMKNYDIEASWKKLCVYVENYLDETIRDDKSPFFVEMESALQKSDTNVANIEDAFRDYLDKLNQVSNMEVCGMYKDEDSQVTHVFARTHSAPYIYYYRRLDQYKHWSAWEEVPLDIKSIDDADNSGVHLIPVIWKKRLFLFWPEFAQKHVPSASSHKTFMEMTSGGATGPDDLAPQPYWEVRLAWSEYADTKWSPRKLSKEVLTPLLWNGFSENYNNLLLNFLADTEPKQYFFRPQIADSQLSIELMIRYRAQSGDDALSMGVFTASDIHSKFSAVVGFINAIAYMDIDISYAQNTRLFAPSTENFYDSFYQTLEKNTSNPQDATLSIAGTTYLHASNSHRLLFSNPLTIPEFENSYYPFFYSDLAHGKTYYADPVAIKLLNWISHPTLSPYLPLAQSTVLSATSVSIGPKPGQYNMAPMMRTVSPPSVSTGVSNYGLSITGRSNDFTGTLAVYAPPFSGTLITGVSIPPADHLNHKLAFHTFFHPFAPILTKKLNEGGIKNLMAANTTEFIEDSAYPDIDIYNDASGHPHLVAANDAGSTFISNCQPDPGKIVPYPFSGGADNYYAEKIDFSEYGAYSIYNWELFYHAPMLLATQLSKNGKYADAMTWFHYIFDPNSTEAADLTYPNSKYWQVLPFKTSPAQSMTALFASLTSDPNQVSQWRDNPFMPFVIARGRPLAFMKNVVMRYLDNLIAWGDDLFRTDTRENINLATQLYVMAVHILGPQPQSIPRRGTTDPESYSTLKAAAGTGGFNDLGDVTVSLENLFPFSSDIQTSGTLSAPASLIGVGQSLYFCTPANDKLLAYWDTVGNRLFNIRHCRNIEGIERSLALFQPPIDPALLVAATAQGLDIGSILSDLDSPAPLYRFSYLSQKAKEFCGSVVSFGNSILSACEKQDGEALSRLRASQETGLLQMVTAVKERQLLEAMANKESLEKSRETAIQKLQHYVVELLGNNAPTVPDGPDLADDLTADSTLPADTIIPAVTSPIDTALVNNDDTGVKVISKEKQEMDDSESAYDWQHKAEQINALAAVEALLPTIDIKGHPMGVGGGISFGGVNLAQALRASAEVIQLKGASYTHSANMAAKTASYIRREQDWVFQANMITRDIVQLDKQITASDIRIQIAQKELDNHNLQIQNSQAIEALLYSKFSNQELYQWMKGQLQDVHRMSYQIAYDMAKKAEKAYQFELGIQTSTFIQYGYYNNTYLGITAGEQLQLALNQLEQSYIEQNVREFELTKHVSLALLDPKALLTLILTGSGSISLPEEIFDLDYPGHYFRRIKSVGISLPCIAGPYTTINSTLRLLSNTIRFNNTLNTANHDPYQQVTTAAGDKRFIQNNTPFISMATSSGQTDSGVFELNFRDERYLPFEGAGAVSTWELELNGKSVAPDGTIIDLSQFDFRSISDVIIHIKYTAREDLSQLKPACIRHLNTTYLPDPGSPFTRLFSFKRDFPTEFYQLQMKQSTQFEILESHFNRLFLNRGLVATGIEILLWPKAPPLATQPQLTLNTVNSDGSSPATIFTTATWNANVTAANDGIMNTIEKLAGINIIGKYILSSNAPINDILDDLIFLVSFHA